MTFALGQDFFLVESQIDHAVRFHFHHLPQTVLGNTLIIGGHIVASERIVLASEPRHDLREFAIGDLLCRLEHQMLEKVSDAGHTRRFISRASAIPDHVRNHRRPVVGHDDHLHPVLESKLGSPCC